MTDIERNKLGMYESVLTFLAENRDITTDFKAFGWSVSKLKRIIDEIKRREKELSHETLEKTILASKAKDELILIMLPLVSALFKYAKERQNLELKEKTKISHSYLVRLRDMELIDKSGAIEALGAKYIAKLKKSGITSSYLKDYKKKRETFKEALGKRVESYISGNTVLIISSLFAESDKIMNNYLDNLVEALSDRYPEFYDEYLLVRDLENQDEIKAMMELEEEE